MSAGIFLGKLSQCGILRYLIVPIERDSIESVLHIGRRGGLEVLVLRASSGLRIVPYPEIVPGQIGYG